MVARNVTMLDRIVSPRVELGSAIAALVLSPVIASILLLSGDLQLGSNNTAAFLDGVFLGPILAIVGAWLDVRLGQPLGLMVLALAVFLAGDGMIATLFVGLPLFLLVLLSFAAAIARRSRGASSEHRSS